MRWTVMASMAAAVFLCSACTTTMAAYDAQSQVSTVQMRLADPALSPQEFCGLVAQLDGLSVWIEGRSIPVVPVRALKGQLRSAMQSASSRYHGGLRVRIEAGEGLPGWNAPTWLTNGIFPF
jgi:predicted Rdx family selenoprotein